MLEQAMKAHRGLDVCLYSFFNLGARWGRWSTPRSGLFIPRKEIRYPLYRRVGGHQSRSERVRKISTQPGFDPQTFQPVTNLYTDCTFPAHCIEKYLSGRAI